MTTYTIQDNTFFVHYPHLTTGYPIATDAHGVEIVVFANMDILSDALEYLTGQDYSCSDLVANPYGDEFCLDLEPLVDDIEVQSKVRELDAYLTDYFEGYAQMAVDGDWYGYCLADMLSYYEPSIKSSLKEYIEENFDVPFDSQDAVVDMVFENIIPEDYTEAYVGHIFSNTPAFDIGFPIEEIEVEIPEGFEGVESSEHYISNGYAYHATDEIIIHRLDRDTLLERIEDALIELEIKH